ncbi:MAG: VanZ family protein [Bacteroidota bacterium]
MKYLLPAVGWSVLILILSTGPGVSVPFSWMDIFSPDKIGHLVVYAVQVILLLWGCRRWKAEGAIGQKVIIAILFFSISFGIAMEGLQWGFFPNRYFEVLDIIANIIGSFTGLFIFRKYLINKI